MEKIVIRVVPLRFDVDEEFDAFATARDASIEKNVIRDVAFVFFTLFGGEAANFLLCL